MRRFNPSAFPLVILIAGLSAQVACSKPAPSSPQPASSATVLQVMRGILFPSSNVIFAAQSDDPEKIAKADRAIKTSVGGSGKASRKQLEMLVCELAQA